MASSDKAPDIDVGRLCSAIHSSRKDLERFREDRKEAVEQYIGGHWGAERPDQKVPVNLIALYVQIVGRSLIPKAPQMMCSTFNKEHSPAVKAGEQWGNREVVKMGLADTLERVVVDALFSVGILKCALLDPAHSSLWAWQTPAGTAFAERVDLDDFVFDTHARDFREASFVGHRYRVPKSSVEGDKSYGPKRKEIPASDDKEYNSGGDERISSLGRGEGEDEEFEEMVDLWEIYLPRTRQLVTLLDTDIDAAGMNDSATAEPKPLRQWSWIGPDSGPYHFLAFGCVPGNAMPKSPVQDLIDTHECTNELYLKLMRQGEDQKELLLAAGSADSDVDRIRNASDGETIRVDNPDKIKVVSYRGPNQANLQLAIHMKDVFSYMAGNLDAMGGLSPQAKTLGQDKMLAASASRTVTDMQKTCVGFVSCVMKALMWYWWHDPFKVMQVSHEIQGLPESRITRTVFPRGKAPRPGRDMARDEDWENLDLQVDPYSMDHKTPAEKVQALMQIVQTVILPMMPALQQAGVQFDVMKLLTLLGQYMNLPELGEIVSLMEAQNPEQQGPGSGGDGGGPKMAPNTTREYLRHSSGGDTADNREKMIANMSSPTQEPAIRSPE